MPFLTTAGLWKNGNFSHMTPLKKIILISLHFANEPWEPLNTLPNSHRRDLKQKIQKFKKVWILKFLNMSLCWKIYHFFHHKFSKNSNKPSKMHRPVIRIDIRRKKIVAKKCLFWPPRSCGKMVIFSHMTPLEKYHSHFFAFCQWTLGAMKYTPK